jgi:DNA-directed RNA polymerase specialized sigma24 family protein
MTATTPEQRAAEQRARKAVIVNPNPNQSPIQAPTYVQGQISADHLAQAMADWQAAEALRQQFLALPPDQQQVILAHAQDLADAEAQQAAHTGRMVKRAFTAGALALFLGTVGRDLYKSTEAPKVN